MSCSSSRHSSRSLVGLLSAARPASFIESYSIRNPTNPSSPIVYRPTRSERVLPGSTRPASYIDPHSTSSPVGQTVPLFCRAAASECILSDAAGLFSPEEFLCNNDNPVSQIKHVPSTASHLMHHSTFCSTNIAIISEHPSEVRNSEDNMPTLSASTVESHVKLNSSNTDTTGTLFQNKYLDNYRGIWNCDTATEIENITESRGSEIDLHISPQFSNSDYTTVIDIAQNQTSHNASQTSSASSSIEILSDNMSYSKDPARDQDKLSPKKSIFVTYPQYSPITSSESDTVKYLKESTSPIKSNAAYSVLTANGDNNKGNTVIEIQEQRSCSENIFAQNVPCNEINAITMISPEYSISATLKGPIKNKDRNSLVSNIVHSTNFTCNINPLTDTDAQYLPPCLHLEKENIQNQEYHSFDTTLGQTVIDSNVSTIRNHNIDINLHLHEENVYHDQVHVESNNQEVRHLTLNETINPATVSNRFLYSQNMRDPAIHNKQDCVVTLTRPRTQNYETPQNSATTDHCRSEDSSISGSCSVIPVSSIQTDTKQNMSVLDLVCSPSTSMSSSTANGQQSVGYQIMESSDASLELSLVTLKSTHSSTSITSTSSENTLSSSSTLPPSAGGSPVHSECTNKRD